MYVVSLRDFQRRGANALPEGLFEPFLLTARGEDFLAIRVPQSLPAELLARIQEVSALMALQHTQDMAQRAGLGALPVDAVREAVGEALAGGGA